MTPKLSEGLYVTTLPLPGAEHAIYPGQLVFLVSTSAGRQALRLPSHQEHHRWVFHDKTYTIRSADYVQSLVARPAEGIYVTARPLPMSADWVIPERSLTSLGYSLQGQPIFYFAKREGAHIHFPAVGYRFPEEALVALKAADFVFAPPPAEVRQLH
jgi:hypothetical protein